MFVGTVWRAYLCGCYIGVSPPLEVVQIGPGGGVVVGNGNVSDSKPVRPPAAIDSVNRFVYYVGEGNILFRLSLDSIAEQEVSDGCFLYNIFLSNDYCLLFLTF